MADIETHSPIQTELDLAGAALRTFFNIADAWDLDVDEQMTLLGLTSRSTFYKWKKQRTGRLQKDTLERISYLLGIFKACKFSSQTPPKPIAGLRNRMPRRRSAESRRLSGCSPATS